MLKISAVYLEKQKSFIPKKIFSKPIVNRFQYQNNQLCLLTQFSVKVLSMTANNLALQVLEGPGAKSANSSFKSEVTLTLIVTSMNDITSLKSYFIFGSTTQSDLQYNALSVKQQCTKKPNKNSFDANIRVF